MRKVLGIVGHIICAMCLAGQPVFAADWNVPQKKFKTYELPGDVRSADVSPDDTVVAMDVVEKSTEASGTVIDTNLVEVWDFRRSRPVATFKLGTVKPLQSPTTHRVIGWRRATVQYSPDGEEIVASFGSTLYVLRASDLKVISNFELQYPPAWVINGPATPRLVELELSPEGRRVIALFQFAREHAISVYDLASGAQTHSWSLPEGSWFSGFVVEQNGQSVLFPTGDLLCSQKPASGISRLDLETGVIETVVATPSLPSVPGLVGGATLAFTSKKTCPNPKEKPELEFEVYDITTRTYRYKGETRYATGWVSASADRLVTYSGDWKRYFDWGDWTGWYYAADHQTFTVWNSRTLQPLAQGQNIYHLSSGRISRSGRYFVTFGVRLRKHQSFAVYEIP